MAQLTGNAIQSSYLGIIKTTDNAAISGVPKGLTDGDGNAINMEVGTGAIKFPSGTVDFTGSTVQGLPVDPNTTYDLAAVASGANINLNLTGSDATTDTVSIVAGTNITLSEAAGVVTIDAASGGSAGLVAGTGTDSMQSDSSLTTVAASASEADTIALGDGAIASSANNIAIGNTANAGGDNAFARTNIAIGFNSDATNEKDVAIGNQAQATGSRTVSIGDSANASGNRAVVVGASSTASAFSSAVFGAFSTASAEGATVVGGYGSSATQTDAIAVGKEADALAAGAIAIGKLAQATATDAIALGKDVTGNIASTVSAKALELQTDSTPTAGGIIMSDAGGTDRRINIDASGGLQIDSTPVGGGGGMVSFGTGKVVNTSYIASDIVQSVFTIPANTFAAGDYFMIRSFETRNGLNATQYSSMWITEDAQTVGQAPSNPSNAAFSFSQVQQSNDATYIMKRHCFVSATNETNWMEQSSGSNDDANFTYQGAPIDANNVDWTVDQYVYLQMWSDSTTGTYTNYGMHLTKMN